MAFGKVPGNKLVKNTMKNTMEKLFALDIGGTHVKYGVVAENGELNHTEQMRTLAAEGGERLLARLITLAQEKCCAEYVGVAISTAGQVNPEDGSIRFATDNLPGWTGIALRQRMSEALGKPCSVENDVNAAALGEYWQGAARGARTALMLTLGTGIGGAIIAGGRLFLGHHGSAGELGHLKLYPGGLPCTCGQSGCYEQYASAQALERLISTSAPAITRGAPELFLRAEQGDYQAQRLLQEWMAQVALGLSSIVPILDPDVIVLGGAISQQGSALTAPIESMVRSQVMPSYRSLTIRAAQLQNDAGLLGAAHAFWSQT